MLVVMKAQATPDEIQAVCEHIEQLGYRAHPMPGAQRTAVGITRIHILSSARRGRRPNADVGRVLSGRSPFRH